MSDVAVSGEMILAGAALLGVIGQGAAVFVWKGTVDANQKNQAGQILDLKAANTKLEAEVKANHEASGSKLDALSVAIGSKFDVLSTAIGSLAAIVGKVDGAVGILIGRRAEDHK